MVVNYINIWLYLCSKSCIALGQRASQEANAQLKCIYFPIVQVLFLVEACFLEQKTLESYAIGCIEFFVLDIRFKLLSVLH